jgi:hypothetical protein
MVAKQQYNIIHVFLILLLNIHVMAKDKGTGGLETTQQKVSAWCQNSETNRRLCRKKISRCTGVYTINVYQHSNYCVPAIIAYSSLDLINKKS